MSPPTGPPVVDPAARQRLLDLARSTLSFGKLGNRVRRVEEEWEELAAPGAAFVTLRRRKNGELRGCCGQVTPRGSLARSVAAMALAAARDDPRFPRVGLREVDSLSISITVLGPSEPIEPEAVEVGRHGLLVTRGGRRGLLLPQVPIEQDWDRETFLVAICHKAGLELGCWRDPGTELSAFEAISWGEDGWL